MYLYHLLLNRFQFTVQINCSAFRNVRKPRTKEIISCFCGYLLSCLNTSLLCTVNLLFTALLQNFSFITFRNVSFALFKTSHVCALLIHLQPVLDSFLRRVCRNSLVYSRVQQHYIYAIFHWNIWDITVLFAFVLQQKIYLGAVFWTLNGGFGKQSLK
jgi:hypothetical protein